MTIKHKKMDDEEILELLNNKLFQKFHKQFVEEINELALENGIDNDEVKDEIKARICFNNYIEVLSERINNGN